MVPFNLFELKSSSVKVEKDWKELGMVPSKRLLCKFKDFNFEPLSSVGMVDIILLFKRFKVSRMLFEPSSVGMKPPILLLDKSMFNKTVC